MTVAFAFYVTIEGTKQKFVGESTGERAANKIAGISFSYEVSSPRDLATGQASGKRQHTPVVFTKEWGASSLRFTRRRSRTRC
jgi:type VI secretion system secreted protein Hcp